MPFSLTSEGRSLTNLFNSNEPNSDTLIIEKQNLLCVFKLVIKDLLNSSLKRERLVEKEYFPLKHFFIVFEHILLHGFTGKKIFSISSQSNRKDPWPLVELISRKSTDTHVSDIITSTKEMTHIRTPLGRVRAWLRLALMQKRLADYFKTLVEQKQELQELYDPGALLLSDECVIISGLLVGLNVLDFNLCLKETILDQPIESTIQYSLYLRERRVTSRTTSSNAHPPGAIQDPIDELDDYSSISSVSSSPVTRTSVNNDDTVVVNSPNDVISIDESNADSAYDQRLSNILDQKNYVEELNRNLQKTVTTLQERLQTMQLTSKSSVDDVAIQKARTEQLEAEIAKMALEKERLQASFQRKIDTLNADIAVERETYQKSRVGLDAIYNELQKKYEDERTSKAKIESVYQTQLSQNNDFLESTKSLEKDIEFKKTINDRIKEENLRLLDQLKIEKNLNDDKEHRIQTSEKENKMLRQSIAELETNLEQINKQIQSLGETNDKLTQALAKSDLDKSSLETDLHVEQESRQRLQKVLTSEKERVSALQFDIHELNIMKQEYETYKKEMMKKQNEYDQKFHEQEETIRELALKLETSIKREDEFREKDGRRLSVWMKDDDVKECCQCAKEFNALRRKHHCRNCGQIFCEACVSTKLPLGNPSKPVRVCDYCCKYVLGQNVINNL